MKSFFWGVRSIGGYVILDRLHAVAVEDDSIMRWHPEAVGNIHLELSDLFASQSLFVVIEIAYETNHPSIHQPGLSSSEEGSSRQQARIFLYLQGSRVL